jgi:DNA-binding transcriptional LysR family regulator
MMPEQALQNEHLAPISMTEFAAWIFWILVSHRVTPFYLHLACCQTSGDLMRSSQNIPMEIVRTVVAVSELGSLTKAADRLGLSQPAVSSQMKRIEVMVGGPIFNKTANGTVSTHLGKHILHQARRILEANDQMLRFNEDVPAGVRLGMSTLFVRPFVKARMATSLSRVYIHSDHSTTIAKALMDGFIDIACIFETPEISADISQFIIDEREEQLVWVRSKDFVLSPGSPIPVSTWPGDDWMIRTLTNRGLAFRIVMNSPDHHAKEAAVEAGLGLTAMPSRMVPASLVIAKEYYLPALPKFKTLLCARPDQESKAGLETRQQLKSLFFS